MTDPDEYVSQTEHPRCVVDGRRPAGEHKGRCTVVALRLPDGSYALFPHGDAALEVRVDADAARALAAFLGGLT